MKLLQITALALLLQAPFSYGMGDQFTPYGSCTVNMTVAGCAAVAAAATAVRRRIAQPTHKSELQVIKAHFNHERDQQERIVHNDESDLEAHTGIRPRSMHQIDNEEQAEIAFLKQIQAMRVPRSPVQVCCCLTLWFGCLSCLSCSK